MKVSEKAVEAEILAWCLSKGWSVDVIDSKAIRINGRMRRNPGVIVGTSDVVGNCDIGLSVYVELKKRRGLCRLEQYNFLKRKIEANAFGIVTDCAAHLEETYQLWLSLRDTSLNEARKYLLSQLPKRVLVDKRVVVLRTP